MCVPVYIGKHICMHAHLCIPVYVSACMCSCIDVCINAYMPAAHVGSLSLNSYFLKLMTFLGCLCSSLMGETCW